MSHENKKCCCHCSCQEGHESGNEEIRFWPSLLSAVLLSAGVAMELWGTGWFEDDRMQLIWYVAAFCPVGRGVMHEAWESCLKGDFFSEFTLMSVASIGAFCIGEYPEAVAVMLLYCIGEYLQGKAVHRAKGHIRGLMELKVEQVRVTGKGTDGATGVAETSVVAPQDVEIGDFIEVLPGERVPLDGILLVESAQADRVFTFNTAALTGESMPRSIAPGEEVPAGVIVADYPVRLQVVRKAGDSAVSRILRMVEEASGRKAPTELFIRRFARIYTSVVFTLALAAVVLPWFYSQAADGFAYELDVWLRRALVFLVISCPCALVVSIPLGYFAGIGAASRRGILFKGGNYLDAVTQVDTVVFDKTGTMTTGEFAVQEVVGLTGDEVRTVASMEQTSNHPVAKAIVKHAGSVRKTDARDIPGYGLSAVIDGEEWFAGTLRLLDRERITYPAALADIPDTLVACARGGRYIGHVVLADMLKEDAVQAVEALKEYGVTHTEMLSGDKQALVDRIARRLRMDKALGDLLPEGKAGRIEELKREGRKVAFVGDGINDAPVLALSDVGIAMGKGGADLAIETADMIIQTDRPVKVAEAIGIGRRTRRIVIQNITLAIGVKLIVMVLGLLDLANLWEAVFADSGVALLCVLNATRIFFPVRK